jgi:hypothetical protein
MEMRNQNQAAMSFNGLDMKNLYKGYLNAKPIPNGSKPIIHNSLMG